MITNTIVSNSAKEILLNAQIPSSTSTYKAVSHEELMDVTLNSIHKAGFTVKEELYSSSRYGNQGNGKYALTQGDSEMNIMIGWQNSYDKSLSLKFAQGSKILICSNGCVSGSYGTFKKKHTGNVQEFTPSTIVEYIAAAGESFELLQRNRDRMKEIDITKKVCAELAGRLFIEEEIITSTQLNIIKREILLPSFDYKADNTLWQFYNHATNSLKLESPATWLKSHIDLHNFITKEYSI